MSKRHGTLLIGRMVLFQVERAALLTSVSGIKNPSQPPFAKGRVVVDKGEDEEGERQLSVAIVLI